VGTLNLKLPHADGSPSASFEHTAHTSAESLEISVRVTTLDAYFSNRVRHTPGAIRLIKCDAEGHELEVFKGGEQLLREVGPDLLFECEARHRHRPVDEVFEYLASLGYEGWYLGPDGMTSMDRFELSLHQADAESDQYVNNFFYKRPDRPGA
jgi:hypothetical protein